MIGRPVTIVTISQKKTTVDIKSERSVRSALVRNFFTKEVSMAERTRGLFLWTDFVSNM